MRRYIGDEDIRLFIEGYSTDEATKSLQSEKAQLLVGLWYSYHYPYDVALNKTKKFIHKYCSLSANSTQNWLTQVYHFVTDNYFRTIYDAANQLMMRFQNTPMIEAY